jgi:hypothetical protein
LPKGLQPNRHVDILSLLFSVPAILIGLVGLWRALRDKMASRLRTTVFSVMFVAIGAGAGLILYFALV